MTRNSLHSVSDQAATSDFRWIRRRNVLPVDTYKKATGDKTLRNVTHTDTQVTAYGGTTLPVMGRVILEV